MNKFVLISGCSGGGKSTLLTALENRGFTVVEEPGRRIIAEERANTGAALPWVDMVAFAHKAVAMSQSDLSAAQSSSGYVFFDRGLVDAAMALQHATGKSYKYTLGKHRHYMSVAFLAPPWPEIYETDGDRRHDLTAAIEEYERLETSLLELGYDLRYLPKTAVENRVEFVLENLGNSAGI